MVTKRNNSRLNNNQRLQLQGWRANCNIQVIIHYHSCLECVAKYALKDELSSVAKDAFTSVLVNSQNVDSDRKAIGRVMMRAVGQRDMSIQEVILSIKLVSSSFQVITASLDGSHKVSLSENKDAFTSVLVNSQNVDSDRKAIGRVMMRAVGQRDMSIQEVILSIKLVSSSFQVITASLDGSHKVSLSENNTLETKNSLLDLYAKRKMFETDHPGIFN